MVYDEEVVARGILEINKLRVVGFLRAGGIGELDLHAVYQQAMESAVVLRQAGMSPRGHDMHHFLDRCGRQLAVQPPHRLRQPALQHHHPEVRPLRRVAFWRQGSPGDVAPARVLKPLEGKLFELVFGDHGFGRLGVFGPGSFFNSFTAFSKSASTRRGCESINVR